MLYAFVSRSRSKPTWLQLKHSILRNFGGLENVDPVDIFYSQLSLLVNKHEQVIISSPDPKGQVSYCHHLVSVARPSYVVNFFKNLLL